MAMGFLRAMFRGNDEIIAETIEKFGENHFACYDLVGAVIARSCGGFLVEVVARVQKGNPIARVSKHALH